MPRPGHLYTAHALAGALWFLAVAMGPVAAAAPTVSSYITPSDNAVGVSESTSLIVQFDQNVVKGSSGNITVYKYSDDSTVETIGSVSAPGNAFVTITLSTLDYGTRYYIFIDNTAIENGSSEAFAGISDKDTWDFTTKDNDGTLVASATVNEPIAVASTVTTTGAAVDVFDFTLTDGGSTDGMALAVTQVVLTTSGPALSAKSLSASTAPTPPMSPAPTTPAPIPSPSLPSPSPSPTIPARPTPSTPTTTTTPR